MEADFARYLGSAGAAITASFTKQYLLSAAVSPVAAAALFSAHLRRVVTTIPDTPVQATAVPSVGATF